MDTNPSSKSASTMPTYGVSPCENRQALRTPMRETIRGGLLMGIWAWLHLGLRKPSRYWI